MGEVAGRRRTPFVTIEHGACDDAGDGARAFERGFAPHLRRGLDSKVAGVGCGFFMARIAVDAASQTEMKVNALPPIVFSTDWVYLGGFVFALVLLSTVIFVWDVFFLKRIRVVETIRISGKSG